MENMILNLELYKEQIVKQYLFVASQSLQPVIDEIIERQEILTRYPIIGFSKCIPKI